MRYENNSLLREYLDRGAAGAHREHMDHAGFELDDAAFAAALAEVRVQHPQLTDAEAQARAVFRLLTRAVPASAHGAQLVVAAPLVPRIERIAPHAWRWLKVAWAIAVLLLAAKAARCEPRPPLTAC